MQDILLYFIGIVKIKNAYSKIPSISECTYMIVAKFKGNIKNTERALCPYKQLIHLLPFIIKSGLYI